VFSTDSLVTLGTGLFLCGSVVLGWWFNWGTWDDLRRDWWDFRNAANLARANKEERQALARGKTCCRCHVPLNPRRLHRAVRSGQADVPVSGWVYRCGCGESTLYDAAGKGRRLEPASAA
jgi:hypothetical protein